MSSEANPNLEQLKSTLQNLVFIYQRMTATAFYPEEFEQAHKSMLMLKEMAEKVHNDVQAMSPKSEETSTTEEAPSEEQQA